MKNKFLEAAVTAFMGIMLAWAGWVSLALIDARERVARIETRLDVLLVMTSLESKPANVKDP